MRHWDRKTVHVTISEIVQTVAFYKDLLHCSDQLLEQKAAGFTYLYNPRSQPQ